MTRTQFYRTLAAVALMATAGLGLAGCDSTSSQKTQQEASVARFNAARVGVLLQLATQQYEVGDYDKCRDTLKQAFGFGQPNADLHILAAKVELEKGTLEEASAHLKTAVQIDAERAEAYYLLGVVYQRWQNIPAAHDYYKLAWDKKPGEALYLLAMIEMKITLGQYDEAQKILDDKLVYFEQTAAMRVALAKIQVLRGDYVQAARFYRDATLLSPEDVNLRQNYAEALFFAGKYHDALAVLEDLRSNPEVTDKPSVLAILGQTYLNVHRARDARTCFAQLTRDNPHDTAAWVNLTKATLQLDDYPQSEALARKMLKDDAGNVQAMILLALSQQKLNQLDAAHATLEKAHQAAPKDSVVLCLLGLAAQQSGQGDQAAKLYAQAVQANPDDAWAQQLLAAARPAAPAPLTPDTPAPPATLPAPVTPAPPSEPAATPETPTPQDPAPPAEPTDKNP